MKTIQSLILAAFFAISFVSVAQTVTVNNTLTGTGLDITADFYTLGGCNSGYQPVNAGSPAIAVGCGAMLDYVSIMITDNTCVAPVIVGPNFVYSLGGTYSYIDCLGNTVAISLLVSTVTPYNGTITIR